MLEVIVLSVALAMDAFAVSIGLGSKSDREKRMTLALMAGVWFGLFQGLMPLIGYMAGHGVLGWVEDYAPWIAFTLLVLIGGKMIWESFGEGVEEEIRRITHKVMLMLAVATSIDAMAAGFSLTLLPVDPFLACFLIGVITFIFSALGVFIGFRSGTWLESRAELFGGVVLILIGFKMLLL
ncbi:manganese efflux pump [Mariprofundus sp. EBB-1]|uniref:manganese efflux pump MntP n=1 Tax=Mariprofundus sp. EBB-1 TaxID=2650971 RepID=UPI000EF24A6D|nr:manganese efflux pump MntP family protein [Mariprofundus sp. EBB-1]RLL52999.1 manganese efflux pump [Mariprofundus sp. EBB-1]